MALALLLFFFWQSADPTADGMKALDAKDYPAAAAQFQKAIEQDPNDYGAHFHLALANSLMHKREPAIAGYRKVLQLKPGLYEAELNLGVLLLDAKQAVEAVPLLESAAQKKPGAFRPQFYLAEALLEQGDAARAQAKYSEALQIDLKSAGAELGLGRALASQKKIEEAAPHFQKAAELDPSYRDALLELAALYETIKYRDEAIAIYKQFPENVAAQERMGQLMLANNDTGAIETLKKAVQRDPTPANHLALATAYRKNKELDKALPHLQQAVEAEPRNFELRMIYGGTLRDLKQTLPAARQFYAATQIRPDAVEAWSDLAGLLTVLEQFPQALQALDRVTALGGEKPGHLFYRAIILDKTKQYKPALDAYQRFLAAAGGQYPDEEFQARQRMRIVQKELSKK